MGIQYSDWVENVGKEEIAHNAQFLLPQCFQKLSVAAALKWVSMEQGSLWLYNSCSHLFHKMKKVGANLGTAGAKFWRVGARWITSR